MGMSLQALDFARNDEMFPREHEQGRKVPFRF
jgi:hypothetical protein